MKKFYYTLSAIFVVYLFFLSSHRAECRDTPIENDYKNIVDQIDKKYFPKSPKKRKSSIVELVRKLKERNPKFFQDPEFHRAFKLHYWKKKRKEAIKIYKKLERKYPNEPWVKEFIAGANETLGNLKTSLYYLKKAIELDKKNELFYFQVCYVANNLRDHDTLLKYSRIGYRFKGDYKDAFAASYIVACIGKKNAKKAKSFITMLLKSEPGNSRYHSLEAMRIVYFTKYSKKRYAKAFTMALEAVKKDKYDYWGWDALCQLASKFYAREKNIKYLDILKMYAEVDNYEKSTLEIVDSIYAKYKLRKLSLSLLSKYEKTIKFKYQVSNILIEKYLSLLSLKEFRDVDKLVYVYNKYKDHINIRDLLLEEMASVVLRGRKNFYKGVREAFPILQRLKKPPTENSSYFIMAHYYLDKGDHKKSIENMYKITARDANFYKSLGEIYYKQKNWKKARDAYLQVKKKSTSNNEINFRLGRVYLKLKDFPNTEKYLKEYLKGETKKELVDKIVAAFKTLGIKN